VNTDQARFTDGADRSQHRLSIVEM